MLSVQSWRAGVKFLRLDQVTFDVPAASRCALVGVTHLHVSRLKTSNTHYSYLMKLLWLPNMTQLASTQPNRPRISRAENVLHVGLYSLALQLRTIALLEYDLLYVQELLFEAPRLNRLKILVLASPTDARRNSALATVLRALPPGLASLDISPQPLAVDFARAIADAIEGEWGGAEQLRVVRLPNETGLTVQEGQAVSAGVEQLRRVAELAEERGIQVEWG